MSTEFLSALHESPIGRQVAEELTARQRARRAEALAERRAAAKARDRALPKAQAALDEAARAVAAAEDSLRLVRQRHSDALQALFGITDAFAGVERRTAPTLRATADPRIAAFVDELHTLAAQLCANGQETRLETVRDLRSATGSRASIRTNSAALDRVLRRIYRARSVAQELWAADVDAGAAIDQLRADLRLEEVHELDPEPVAPKEGR